MSCEYCALESCIYDARCKQCTVRRVARLTWREIKVILDDVSKEHGKETELAMCNEILLEAERLKGIGQL